MNTDITEQIQNDQHFLQDLAGVNYRASGNLLIVRQVLKTCITPVYASGSRSSITEFSPGSGRRMRRYLRECTSEYSYMLTLTYPEDYPTDGAEVKEHLRRFMQELRRCFYRSKNKNLTDCVQVQFKPISCFWFLEFQKRGAPHFHIFTTWSPSKEWVSTTWYRIVNSDDPKHLKAGTRTEKLRAGRAGTISYASKYAAKLEQKRVPIGFENIGRWWGVYGCRITLSADVYVSRGDSKDELVSMRIESLFDALDDHIFMGRARILNRIEGFLLVQLKTKEAQDDILFHVEQLRDQIGGEDGLFEDAELDNGTIPSW